MKPGEIHTAIRMTMPFPAVAMQQDDGMVCAACTGLQRVDSDHRDDGRIGSTMEPRNIAIGPDGATYTTALIRGENAYELIAFNATDKEQWRTRLPDYPEDGLPRGAPAALAANAEHVYLSYPDSTIVLDGASGAAAWSSPYTLLAVSHDGSFAAQGDTVVHLDRTGAVRWRRPMTGPHTLIKDAVATLEDRVVVVGLGENTVDLGDRVLEGPSGRPFSFVVELDSAGAPRWAYKIDDVTAEYIADSTSNGAFIAGTFAPQPGAAGRDAFLARVTEQRVIRMHRIGGIGHQDILGLHASGSSAWLQVGSYADPISGDPNHPDPTIEVGAHQLEGSGHFLLGMLP